MAHIKRVCTCSSIWISPNTSLCLVATRRAADPRGPLQEKGRPDLARRVAHTAGQDRPDRQPRPSIGSQNPSNIALLVCLSQRSCPAPAIAAPQEALDDEAPHGHHVPAEPGVRLDLILTGMTSARLGWWQTCFVQWLVLCREHRHDVVSSPRLWGAQWTRRT